MSKTEYQNIYSTSVTLSTRIVFNSSDFNKISIVEVHFVDELLSRDSAIAAGKIVEEFS